MKNLLLIVLSFVVLNLVTHAHSAVGSSLKTEGSCSGTLADGSEVSLNYFSDFDGCKNVSKSAITFTAGVDGLFTGSRVFNNNQDIYNFPLHRLTLRDSTGNTTSTLRYRDENGDRQAVELQCEVRDYEYSDC
jgi:hypothetical protein